MAAHLKDSLLHGSDHQDTHASDSRWRHQEGHAFAVHARDASRSRDASLQPSIDGSETQDEPAHKRKPGRKHLSFSSDLADFLNDSRITPPTAGRGKHTPIFVKGSHGDEFADGVAARNSNGHLLQKEAAAALGTGLGWEVKCGPLLNYRRMEDDVWHGSVLIVVKSVETESRNRVPVLEMRKVGNGHMVHGEGTSNINKPVNPTAPSESDDDFLTPRTTSGALPYIDSKALRNKSNGHGDKSGVQSSNNTGNNIVENGTSKSIDSFLIS